jgi:hypothetical protein
LEALAKFEREKRQQWNPFEARGMFLQVLGFIQTLQVAPCWLRWPMLCQADYLRRERLNQPVLDAA